MSAPMKCRSRNRSLLGMGIVSSVLAGYLFVR